MADPFDTLGVEPRFDLDLKHLETRHRTLSGALHPDRYSGKSASERRLALNRAIEVNSAWRTLRDPVERAESLLKRAGVAVGETAEPKPSPMLLMEMMEVREELSAAHGSKDLDRVGALADQMRDKQDQVIAKLKTGFRQASDPATLSQLLPVLGELRYLRRFFEELDAIEEDLMTS